MFATLAAIVLGNAAYAVPAQFTHQGRLLDADGVPLADEATITFRISDAETGGFNIWEETLTVSLTNGFYSAILGADEDTNPLDIEILSQAPVWLEVQLDGEPAMFPRTPVNSVPYAAMATVAEEVSGGPVDATEVSIGGTLVIDESGEWVGPSSTVTWSDIADAPEDFSDGVDADTMAELATSCSDGDVPVWDAVIEEWSCAIDQDMLAGMFCLEGQLILWSDEALGWICGDDADTQLSADEVDSIVADNGYAMTSEVFSGSFLDLVDVPAGLADGDDDTTTIAWSALTDVPAGFADGVDDGLEWSDVESSLGDAAVDLHPDTTIGGEPFASVTGGGTQTTGSVVLGSLEVATLSPSSDVPQFTHSAWWMGSRGWEPLSYRPEMQNLGDGSDGVFEPDEESMSMAGGEYNYTEFELPEGHTITVTGSEPLVIRSQTTLKMAGTIKANGGNASAWYGGAASAGGAPGRDGGCGSSGTTRSGIGGSTLLECCEYGCVVGSASAGQGGYQRRGLCETSESNKGGGGGGGGGMVFLLARYIDVAGTIEVVGGNGSVNRSTAGGGGAGGNVYLEAAGIRIDSSAHFNVAGGEPGTGADVSAGADGIGEDGRLAIKARSESYPPSVGLYMDHFSECAVDAMVATEADLHYDSDGLHIRNFGVDDQTVVLTMIE